MKLKNVVQIAVLGVIGFVLAMGIGMLTGLLGVVSLYVSAGFGAFFVAPVYVIMARKVQCFRHPTTQQIESDAWRK